MTDHMNHHGNSTIYQFKLLRRIRHGFWFRYLPHLLIITTIAIVYVNHGIFGAIRFLLICVILQLLYLGTTWLWHIGHPPAERQDFFFSWYFPWFGVSYKHAVSIQRYLQQLLLLWVIPASIIAATAPWLPSMWIYISLIVHLECLWPRSTIILTLLAKREVGIVRVEKDSTSLYAP